MEKVLGIGGLFFRSRGPTQLAKWYNDHLGIDLVPNDYVDRPWQQQAGPTAFAPFPEATNYFGERNKQWMVNFRVTNLDAMVGQLRGRGVSVEIDPLTYPNGRFARLSDPEGNPIELWEPSGRDATGEQTPV